MCSFSFFDTDFEKESMTAQETSITTSRKPNKEGTTSKRRSFY
jgi:hypothetical protein